MQVLLGDPDPFSGGPLYVLAQHHEPAAQAFFALRAEIALATPQRGVDNDPVSCRPSGHARADFHYLSRGFRPPNMRKIQAQARDPSAHPKI
jgi:hypothetical protein